MNKAVNGWKKGFSRKDVVSKIRGSEGMGEVVL